MGLHWNPTPHPRPPAQTLGAPQVGHDAQADAWLEQQLRDSDREDEIPNLRKQMNGYPVLALAPASAGLPPYSSVGEPGAEPYTFRCLYLMLVSDIIGPDLQARARQPMTAAELKDYGQAVLDRGREYARTHGVERLEQQYEPPKTTDDQSPELRAHIVLWAAKWCLFWAEHGHGLEPSTD